MKKNISHFWLIGFMMLLSIALIKCKKDDSAGVTGSGSGTVTIGTQVWTTKNLEVTTYRNGDPIPQVTDPTAWTNLTTGAWCYYNNDPANGSTYGKLYNYYAVNDSRGLAPQDYHVPSDAEWTTLITFLGGLSTAGGSMKETGTTHWTSPNTGATNSSGFTGLPGGTRSPGGTAPSSFKDVGGNGYWWSSTQNSTFYASHFILDFFSGYAFSNSLYKTYGFSVRCLRN